MMKHARIIIIALLSLSCQGCFYMYSAINSYDRGAPIAKVTELKYGREYVSTRALYLDPKLRDVSETTTIRNTVEIPRGARITVREVRRRREMYEVVKVREFYYLLCDVDSGGKRHEAVIVPALKGSDRRQLRIDPRVARRKT